MGLIDIAVKNAKPSDKPTKISDGKDLYLLVHPNGSKYWQAAYRFDGKQKSSLLNWHLSRSITRRSSYKPLRDEISVS